MCDEVAEIQDGLSERSNSRQTMIISRAWPTHIRSSSCFRPPASMTSPTSLYRYSLSPYTYTLPLLHAAAHPSSKIIGLFLGRISVTTSSSGGRLTEVDITDALPLLHDYTSLAPMIEVGMEMARVCAKDKRLEVVGFWLGKEGSETGSGSGKGRGAGGLGRIGERVWDGLKSQFEGAFALIIDSKLGACTTESPYIVYTSPSPLSPSLEPTSLPEPFHLAATSKGLSSGAVYASVLELIRSPGAHRDVLDFDDHLEDAFKDWFRNIPVRDAVDSHFA